ncbi:hypothetical protein GH714_029917 [Hevea brasiliensis]|uniref:histidine kinase n=1 Tax=Hevea brasiliensis TaxID=3981 RepID=A0A6A6KV69_HEVBR|nr:hypothetical protein GH714_029917 [Hevea brasiliensis]
MSLLHVFGFGLKVGHLLWMLCCWIVSVISMNWFINGGIVESKTGLLGDGGKMWLRFWEKISGNSCKMHHHYYQYFGSKRVRKTWWRKLLVAWVIGWIMVSLWILWYMSSQATEKRKETLSSMCDERARMLQDQFNVSMNHVQAMSILISTFHHGKNPSAIDQEDRENVLRARESGTGVLTAPFRLLKTNRLGVILTFAVYKRDLPSNATPNERIQATDGYLGGVFDIESLVEKLLQQLASKQTILVDVYDTTNQSHPISMYGSNVSDDGLQHVSSLNFGDPHRKHEMHCRFKQKPPWPWLAITTSFGVLVIALLIGHIFHATVNRIAKVEDDYHEMMELKKRAEAADIAKSQFLATVSHEIRTPMNGVLGMLHMLMDTDLDLTQQDYVRTAQDSGKALVSLINEVLDQAKIESGKLELEEVQFNLRAILDDVLSLFSDKSQGKGVETLSFCFNVQHFKVIADSKLVISQVLVHTSRAHLCHCTSCGGCDRLHRCRDRIIIKEHLEWLPVADRCGSWAGFRTFSQEGSGRTLLPCSSDFINLIISVEDTGEGIPLEAQSRIFTPFMQVGPSTSRKYGGTGIGLSISKCLVGLMNGEIGFVSIPKIGTTFTFTAVFTNGCTNSNEYKSHKISNQSNAISSEFHGMTALVVDPRPVRAKVSRYHIQRLGINVEVVSDLNQALCSTSNGNAVVNMVLIEQEVWDRDSSKSALFVNNIRKIDHSVSLKLFLLANSISSFRTNDATSGVYTPSVIMKPLRASMLAASLQRAMGVGNKGNARNGELSNLLLGRKILVVDDNGVNLKVAAGALKKYGADVVCADSGEKAIKLLTTPPV